jgi:hypothetical protein
MILDTSDHKQLWAIRAIANLAGFRGKGLRLGNLRQLQGGPDDHAGSAQRRELGQSEHSRAVKIDDGYPVDHGHGRIV